MMTVRLRATRRTVEGQEDTLRPYSGDFFCFGNSGKQRQHIGAEFVCKMFRDLDLVETDQNPDVERLLQDLERLATYYGRWKSLPLPNRALATAQLGRLSRLVRRRKSLDAQELDNLIKLALNPSDAARPALWTELMRLGIKAPALLTYDELKSADTDWAIYAEAADRAKTYFGKGDYTNTALAQTVYDLLGLFEEHSEARLWLGLRYKSPNAFVGYFFRLVDHELSPNTLTNMIDRVKAQRRKMSTMALPSAEHMCQSSGS